MFRHSAERFTEQLRNGSIQTKNERRIRQIAVPKSRRLKMLEVCFFRTITSYYRLLQHFRWFSGVTTHFPFLDGAKWKVSRLSGEASQHKILIREFVLRSAHVESMLTEEEELELGGWKVFCETSNTSRKRGNQPQHRIVCHSLDLGAKVVPSSRHPKNIEL